MSSWVPVAVLLVLGASWVARASQDFAVFGYCPNYRGHLEASHLAGRVTHAIAFSLEVQADGAIANAVDTLCSFSKWARLEQDAIQFTPMFSVGGGGRSEGFGAATATPESRATFVESLRRLVLHPLQCENGVQVSFQGIDLDWESPRTLEEWDNYLQFIVELRSAVPDATLSLAIHPRQELAFSPDAGLPAAQSALEALDYIHVMTYDNFGNPNGHATTKWAKESISSAQKFLPSSKITLGLPFYGRHISTSEAKTWAELASENFPTTFIANDAGVIDRKVRWAMKAGLGGVMIWEVGQDVPRPSENSLLDIIAKAVFAKEAKGAAGDEL